MHTTSDTITRTCTVVTGAALHRCGAPAVHSFTSRSGELLHECEDHAVVLPTRTEEWAPGTPVRVVHRTWPTSGVIVSSTPTRCTVRLVLRSGAVRVRTLHKDEVTVL